ncbi:MAG TPA: PilN domain-containing protein [Pseudobacteroides sp.]|uniref:PilN domain-containing protein n=1 Tax=Pseudobacteroides sp. TaxID=1968840 RepID=UPI002F926F42
MKDLNLIPKSYYLNKRKKEKKKLIFLSAFLLGFAIIAAVAYPVYTKLKLKAQLEDIQKGVETTTGYKVNQDKLADANMRFLNLKTESEKLSMYSFSSIKVIEKIRQSMPKKLFISDFSITNKNDGNVNILLIGNSASEDDIVSFLYSLRKDNFFDNIYISSIQKTQTTQNIKSVIATPLPGAAKNKKNSTAKAKNTGSQANDQALSTEANETIVSYNFDMTLNYLIK